MATLKEDLAAISDDTMRYQARALWEGDHPSPFSGFLTNYLGGLIKGTTHGALGEEIMQWVAFLRTIDADTGKYRHEVLFPGLPWEGLLRHVGFDDRAVDVWVRAIQTNPDVSAVEVHKKLLAAARADERAARDRAGRPPESERKGPSTYKRGDKDGAAMRRLKRDFPDLAERVVAGEMTLNAAALKAGIRKAKVQVEVTPEAFARAIAKHLPEFELRRKPRCVAENTVDED